VLVHQINCTQNSACATNQPVSTCSAGIKSTTLKMVLVPAFLLPPAPFENFNFNHRI
jgi:hypothetical protein